MGFKLSLSSRTDWMSSLMQLPICPWQRNCLNTGTHTHTPTHYPERALCLGQENGGRVCLGHVLDLCEMVESLKLSQTKPHLNYHPYKEHFLLGICRTKGDDPYTHFCVPTSYQPCQVMTRSLSIPVTCIPTVYVVDVCTNYLSIVRISSHCE